MVPELVIQNVERVLEEKSGRPARVTSTAPIGGGCINPSAMLETESEGRFFLKWNPASPGGMFEAEADGLTALAGAGTLRVPEVLGHGGSGNNSNPAWLLLEFIPQGRPGADYGRRLGEGLADLHSSGPTGSSSPGEDSYGWHRDNFIGSLHQENGPSDEWALFWRDRRLAPQLALARTQGHFAGARGEALDDLLDRMEEVMTGSSRDGPALLHGDLWSGNYYAGPMGEPVLIDPAVYMGAGEVDLAMMELFGSFPRGFTEGYGSRREMAPEYEAFRRDLYQLYYLLVHVNLFGGSYVGGSLAAAERALRGS